jgi:hypothetical protein
MQESPHRNKTLCGKCPIIYREIINHFAHNKMAFMCMLYWMARKWHGTLWGREGAGIRRAQKKAAQRAAFTWPAR